MNYKMIFFALLFAPIFLNAQENKNDTLFLEKSEKYGSLQSVFLEDNRNSTYYDAISDFKFGEFDGQAYQWSLDYLKDNNLNISHKKSIVPIKKWIILHQYKNTLYAYKPCDFFTHFQVSITDSVYIDYTGEGPVANQIVSQQKINGSTYKLHLKGMYWADRMLTIKIIDKQKGIAVFKDQNGEDVMEYLMIDAAKIRQVPLIVNRCGVHKQPEFDFETIDFEKLLNNNRNANE